MEQENTPMIKYNDGNYFKITITTDGSLRIKIPKKYKDTAQEMIWIQRCYIIRELVLYINTNKATLRGRVDSVGKNVRLYYKSRRGSKIAFRISCSNEIEEKS